MWKQNWIFKVGNRIRFIKSPAAPQKTPIKSSYLFHPRWVFGSSFVLFLLFISSQKFFDQTNLIKHSDIFRLPVIDVYLLNEDFHEQN